MKSTFEELGGTYKQVEDYLLPDVEVPENPGVGFWGLKRRQYLLEHQPALYTALFLGGKLVMQECYSQVVTYLYCITLIKALDSEPVIER